MSFLGQLVKLRIGIDTVESESDGRSFAVLLPNGGPVPTINMINESKAQTSSFEARHVEG
jgi:hypothetical protein